MDNQTIDKLYNTDFEYILVVKNSSDIISGITHDPTEQLVYESIIAGIESNAADAVKAGKTAQLPAIGCIRKSPVRQAIKDNKDELSQARQNMSASTYKEHVQKLVIDTKQNQSRIDRNKLAIRNVRSRYKKQYDRYHLTIGKAYAELFIYSLLCLSEVPYVLEVQEAYDRLNGI